MNLRFLSILFLMLMALGVSAQQFGNRPAVKPQKMYVGIDSEKMDHVMTAQNNSYWCWAATIEMVLSYYDLDLPQDSIVKEVYGLDENEELPDNGATLETINENLNTFSIDTNGVYFSITSDMGRGAPNPAILIKELSQKKPVIIGYDTGEGGHTVIITAVTYYNTQQGPKITSIIVRDPMPDAAFDMNNGRIEYSGKELARRIHAYWLIDVVKYEEE